MKSSLRSLLSLATALPLAALAQQPMQPPGQAPATSTPEVAFMRANANGDGKLSKTEAAGLRAVASKFDALDNDKDGMLSISEYMAAFEAPKQ